MTRQRIALCINELDAIGGAERVIVHLLELSSRIGGIEFIVIPLEPGGRLASEMRKVGVRVIDLGARGRWDLRVIARLAGLLARERVALIHAHLPRAGIVARLAARMAGVACLYTEHSVPECYHPIIRLLNRWTLPLCQRIVAVSNSTRMGLGSVSAKVPTRVVYNGVATMEAPDPGLGAAFRRLFAIGPDELVVGSMGNLRAEKGHRFLIQAFKRISEEIPGSRLLIVGQDLGEGPSLRRLAVEIGVESKVIFAGFHKEHVAAIRAMDVFVQPSLIEGLPMAVLEALALGRPVVATRVPGVLEVIEHGKSGLLVPPGDPEALAEAAILTLRDASVRRCMGEAGPRVILERFAVSKMLDGYAEVYGELLPRLTSV